MEEKKLKSVSFIVVRLEPSFFIGFPWRYYLKDLLSI